jgi:hypothetical protein
MDVFGENTCLLQFEGHGRRYFCAAMVRGDQLWVEVM